MKCQKCTKAATMHITEILGEDQFEERHLCEECAQKYLSDSEDAKKSPAGPGAGISPLEDEEPGPMAHDCPVCGIKFVEFRNSGRLGCPHDYQEFRAELLPLLENIHGETRHVGKTPRRRPKTQSELIQLRKRLQQAVTREAYEEAAQLRDRIRHLEEG
jgi:protein arginine kinase activator